MKKLFYLSAFLLSLIQPSACAQSKGEASETKMGQTEKNKINKMTPTKTLVVYFSRTGNNYAVGNIKEGNTQIVANFIAQETGAEVFRINPIKAYPEDYTECTEVAKKERDSKARPEYQGDIDIAPFDTIFIGYPNWWGDAPMPVYTFIDKHNWNGKTVVPFCTHEGSGLSNTREIKEACKGASLLKGFDIYGHTAQKDRSLTEKSVKEWLLSMGKK